MKTKGGNPHVMVPATDTSLHRILAGDIELIGLVSGLRQVAKKEGPDADAMMELAPDMRADGWTVERNTRTGCVYVSKDVTRVERLLELENMEFDGGSPDARRRAIHEIGLLLGYPDCCAAAFAALPVQDDSHVMPVMLARAAGAGPLPWQLNFLVPMAGPVFYYPCRPDCPASAALAARYLAAMESMAPGATERLREVLARPVLAAGRWDFVVFDGRVVAPGTVEYVSRRVPRDFHPVPPPSRAFEMFLARLPAAGTVRVADGAATVTDAETGAVTNTFAAPGGLAIMDYR